MSVHHGRSTSCKQSSASIVHFEELFPANLAQPGILFLKKLPLELGLVDGIALLRLPRFEWLEKMLRRVELREPGIASRPTASSLSFTTRIVDAVTSLRGACADRGKMGKGGVSDLEFAVREVRDDSAKWRLPLLRSVMDSTVDKCGFQRLGLRAGVLEGRFGAFSEVSAHDPEAVGGLTIGY